MPGKTTGGNWALKNLHDVKIRSGATLIRSAADIALFSGAAYLGPYGTQIGERYQTVTDTTSVSNVTLVIVSADATVRIDLPEPSSHGRISFYTKRLDAGSEMILSANDSKVHTINGAATATATGSNVTVTIAPMSGIGWAVV